MSLQSFYIEMLLEHTNPIDVTMQRRIVEHARRNDDTDMLLALLGRRELTADADLAIGEISDLRVLLAWMLRQGRDPELVAERAAREKRVTVLAALAGTPGLPSSVYENLAEHNSEKVLKALITGSAVDDGIRRRAVRGLVTRAPRAVYSSTCSTSLRDIVHSSGSSRELWDEIGEHAFALPYLISVTTYATPTTSHLSRWANDLEEIHDFDGGKWRDLTPLLVTEMLSRSLTREQHQRILEATGSILAGTTDLSARWVTDLSHVRQLVLSYDIETEELLHRFTEERDPSEASKLLHRLHQTCRNAQRRRLLLSAANHPGIPLELLVDLRYDLDIHAVRALTERLDAAERTDLLELWLEDSAFSAHLPAFAAYLSNPEQFLSRYLERNAADGNTWPAWALETREVRENPVHALNHLPWNVLANAASSVAGLTAAVTHALSNGLGDDDERWRTFEVLGAEFDGTLTDLLLAVANLTS